MTLVTTLRTFWYNLLVWLETFARLLIVQFVTFEVFISYGMPATNVSVNLRFPKWVVPPPWIH